MAKLVFLAFSFVAVVVQAKSLKLELYAEATLPPKLTLAKEPVGGLSGIVWQDQKLLAVSDDRGKFGAPRFYELDLILKSSKAEFNPVKFVHLSGVDKKWVLDLEALLVLPSGDLLFSSEGDNNSKPRSWPRIFRTSRDGAFKSELPLPEKFLPNLIGLQTKGIEDNRGFEGMTSSPDGQNIYLLTEAPIVTDQSTTEEPAFWLRMVHLVKEKEIFKVAGEFPYLLEKRSQTQNGSEVYRGIAELLFWMDHKFITLERGVRLGSKGISYTASLYLTDFEGTKDVSKIENLSTAKVSSARKEKLLDLESVLAGKIENFEGLAWGPLLPDGRKSLLVISDNNFSKREKTQLLVFAVKEVE